jgi:hypothetical protein
LSFGQLLVPTACKINAETKKTLQDRRRLDAPRPPIQLMIPSLRAADGTSSSRLVKDAFVYPTGCLSSFHSYPLWKNRISIIFDQVNGSFFFSSAYSRPIVSRRGIKKTGPASIIGLSNVHSRQFSPLMLSYRKGISVDLQEKHLAFKALARRLFTCKYFCVSS